MAYSETTALHRIAKLNKRIRAIQGGTSASKTISVLMYLIHLCQTDKHPTLTSVVSESFPHLKRGAMRDFLTIMEEHKYFKDSQWNKSENTYVFETGSKLEFFSADQPGKVRGPRRDRLFVNEANRIPYETFDQLEVRTKEFIFLDWNPTNEFWFYTDILGHRNDVDHIILTYLDNEALAPEIVATIEQRRGLPGWWKVYGEGQLGEVEGKIYKNWRQIDEMPHEARLVRYGIDFGYTNDPTAIVALYEYNGGYIVDEVAYSTGMSNRQIADVLQNVERALVIADSAEPKSIDEIRSYGINIMPTKKGRDSVNQGIQYVQTKRVSVTRRSFNVWKDYMNYMWVIDKDGRILNEPNHDFSHSMDAVRYSMESLRPSNELSLRDRMGLLQERQRNLSNNAR